MDLFFAAIPITFVWNLHRPVWQRLLVAFLIFFGITASICSILKIVFLYRLWYSPNPDSANLIHSWIMFWMELYLNIIGALLPSTGGRIIDLLHNFDCMKESPPMYNVRGRLELVDINTYRPSSVSTANASKLQNTPIEPLKQPQHQPSLTSETTASTK
jgi:uncharacterized protein YggT (Ycf19 family)